jgi:transcription initiation factor TFIID subunit 2
MIAALGNAFSVTSPGESDRSLIREANNIVERLMTVDRLVPSYHNAVSIAGLQYYAKMVMVGLQFHDPQTFLAYTR